MNISILSLNASSSTYAIWGSLRCFIGLLYDLLHFVVGLRGQGDLRLDNADALPLDLLEHVLEGSGDGGGSVRAIPAPRLVHTPALQFRQRCFDECDLDVHVHSPV